MFGKASPRDNFCEPAGGVVHSHMRPRPTTPACIGFSPSTGGVSLQMNLISLSLLTASMLGLWTIVVEAFAPTASRASSTCQNITSAIFPEQVLA
eukprot:CAMPEP_0204004260 /NCGR_PEP_ID=MMETSP0360-20130528/18253_1 /ASSEMBLY_ACC=CAM_ASM_000342 /TAXON_ID=268821 /ORGANISM="Scrippsiella Hangoei, Strain SHTV-5" /LENGTH=94 /DNA_ID=CAMNT_0050946091 /DNA_START=21 /DNA_END=301 /DNA_ORIENTATION=+